MQSDTDNRRARADGVIATLSPSEMQRYSDSVNTLRLHWASLYGDRLSPLVIDNMASEAVLNISVLEAIHGDPPITEQAWRALAHEIASGDSWVTRNLEHSDAKVKAEIRENTLAALPGARRIAMQRSGELETYIDNAVREELDNRSAQRATSL